MSIKIVFIAFFTILTFALFSQRSVMELTFTAVNNATYVKLDSIKVMNRTQGGDTLLYWPDTVLTIYYVGIPEGSGSTSGFHVFQNYPNPVVDQTTISLYVPVKDRVSLVVTDMPGRVILESEKVLEQGMHTFRIKPAGGNLYLFTAVWQGQSSSIKILHSGLNSGGTNSLVYLGREDFSPHLKAMKDIQDFSFTPGDELLCIGYTDTLQSGMLVSPEESQTCTFQLATNIPCPGTPTVEYQGQVYNTIQIFSQCWLKENLNVGEMIPGTMEQSNNGTIEKYCCWNEPDSCSKYGGLYQWNEMMQYTNQSGTQGICPPGWHLPTDEEWKVLEGAVDSQYGIGNSIWDLEYDRGLDAGANLKTTSGWYYGGNGTDLYGFSGMPHGVRDNEGSFGGIDEFGFWWTSTEYDSSFPWWRYLTRYGPVVVRYYYIPKEEGMSVRCLRDYHYTFSKTIDIP